MLPVARRTNTPFDWASVPLPKPTGRRKPGAIKTMEAARDHGFTNGLVIPFHYIDQLGRQYSSVCTFFWSDRPKRFVSMLRQEQFALHVILLYWAQKAIDLSTKTRHKPSRFLDSAGLPMLRGSITDRERDVLSWAGRGKSQDDTAAILRTLDEYGRDACEKCHRKARRQQQDPCRGEGDLFRLDRRLRRFAAQQLRNAGFLGRGQVRSPDDDRRAPATPGGDQQHDDPDQQETGRRAPQ